MERVLVPYPVCPLVLSRYSGIFWALILNICLEALHLDDKLLANGARVLYDCFLYETGIIMGTSKLEQAFETFDISIESSAVKGVNTITPHIVRSLSLRPFLSNITSIYASTLYHRERISFWWIFYEISSLLKKLYAARLCNRHSHVDIYDERLLRYKNVENNVKTVFSTLHILWYCNSYESSRTLNLISVIRNDSETVFRANFWINSIRFSLNRIFSHQPENSSFCYIEEYIYW